MMRGLFAPLLHNDLQQCAGEPAAALRRGTCVINKLVCERVVGLQHARSRRLRCPRAPCC
jgi:hypothetical protein